MRSVKVAGRVQHTRTTCCSLQLRSAFSCQLVTPSRMLRSSYIILQNRWKSATVQLTPHNSVRHIIKATCAFIRPHRSLSTQIAHSSQLGSGIEAVQRPLYVLGIESSCDDTAAAVVSSDGRVLGEAIAGQADIHAAWGGVVPSLAKEAHQAAIDRVVNEALSSANITPEQLDAVAVTIGPGLSMCLRVGVLKAREIAATYRLRVVPVHHMEAHALVARLACMTQANESQPSSPESSSQTSQLISPESSSQTSQLISPESSSQTSMLISPEPSSQLSSQPSSQPSSQTSSQTSSQLSSQTLSQPSSQPSSQTSSQLSSQPLSQPSSQPSSPLPSPSSPSSPESSSQPSTSTEPSQESSSQPSISPVLMQGSSSQPSASTASSQDLKSQESTPPASSQQSLSQSWTSAASSQESQSQPSVSLSEPSTPWIATLQASPHLSTSANLTSANLTSANPTSSTSTLANLTSATSTSANSTSANLTSANSPSATSTSADSTYSLSSLSFEAGPNQSRAEPKSTAQPESQQKLQFPFLCLLVSGGHNLLVLVKGVGEYVQLGSTVDDALGEAYDKVARLLGLELKPHGGAALERLALLGDAKRFVFAQPMKKHKNCDFSYAGLKTSVRLAIERELTPLGSCPEADQIRADIAASFQRVAVAHLRERTVRAVDWAREMCPELSFIVVAGGVAANKYVRSQLTEVAEASGLELVVPPARWCTDNGVMVAWTGLERLQLGIWEPPPATPIPAEGEWIDLRARWPLTDEKHPLSMPLIKSMRQARLHVSLTNLTRTSLEGAAQAMGTT